MMSGVMILSETGGIDDNCRIVLPYGAGPKDNERQSGPLQEAGCIAVVRLAYTRIFEVHGKEKRHSCFRREPHETYIRL